MKKLVENLFPQYDYVNSLGKKYLNNKSIQLGEGKFSGTCKVK